MTVPATRPPIMAWDMSVRHAIVAMKGVFGGSAFSPLEGRDRYAYINGRPSWHPWDCRVRSTHVPGDVLRSDRKDRKRRRDTRGLRYRRKPRQNLWPNGHHCGIIWILGCRAGGHSAHHRLAYRIVCRCRDHHGSRVWLSRSPRYADASIGASVTT